MSFSQQTFLLIPINAYAKAWIIPTVKYFEPKASSEWEEGRNERIESNEAESAEGEQAGDDFKCELCDFTSTWKGGFNIHMGRKHKLIPQLDGGDFSSELNELDDWYEGSKHYWKSGDLGQGYQFL